MGQSVKPTALESLEQNLADVIKNKYGKYPYEMLSYPSAVYVTGLGVTITVRVNLVYANMESPFRPAAPTAEEYAVLKQHKVEKIPFLEKSIQDYLIDAAASPALDSLRPTEQIAVGVTLFYYPKEDSTGLPRRIVMSAEQQKLLQARRDKLDLTTVIQESKL